MKIVTCMFKNLETGKCECPYTDTGGYVPCEFVGKNDECTYEKEQIKETLLSEEAKEALNRCLKG